MSQAHKTDILFVHGAGAGTYEWTIPMIEALAKGVGDQHKIHFLKMPDPEIGDYHAWADVVEDTLTKIKGEVILVGHSYGGSVLLRYLAEHRVINAIPALFLLAVPYWGKEGWEVPDFEYPEGFETKLDQPKRIFIYHCEDDEDVPFYHHKLYHQKIPEASVHPFKKGGHAMKGVMPDVGRQIVSLTSSK